MHLNSELLFAAYASKYFSTGQRVLEVGPHGYPSYYYTMLGNSKIEWHTLDISAADIAGGDRNPLHITSTSEYNYPIEDNTFDVVISAQVMEHVKKVWMWVDELKRITKKDGLVILIVPVSWPYHAVPVDCWRIYPEGMRALMDECELKILECRYESLERELLPRSTPTVPGAESMNIERRMSGKLKFILLYNRIVSILGLKKIAITVSVAYDTICIARKE